MSKYVDLIDGPKAVIPGLESFVAMSARNIPDTSDPRQTLGSW